MVVRRKVAEEHPWVPPNIFNAFKQAKDLVNEEAQQAVAPCAETGLTENGGFTKDLFPYGVRSNYELLSAIAGFSTEQGLTPRRVGLEEIFALQTFEL